VRPSVGAVSYGVGKNGYTLKDDSHYVRPEMVTQLPASIPPPKAGPAEVVEEIPSVTDYYDGGAKLNKITITCRIYANPTDCVHQSNCGWCGASNSCIAGTTLGPLEQCAKTSYIFSAPNPNWRPQNIIKENVGGVSFTVVAK
jgi:hypothetical protein